MISLKKIFYREILIAIIIASTLFVPYFGNYFPESRDWNTYMFNIESVPYGTVRQYVIFLLNNFVLIILYYIWLITCPYKWKWGLICPIALYLSHVIDSVLYINKIDNFSGGLALFLCPILLLLVLVEMRRFYAINRKGRLHYIDSDQVPRLFNNKFGKWTKKSLKSFKILEKSNSKKELKLLIQLKQELNLHLNYFSDNETDIRTDSLDKNLDQKWVIFVIYFFSVPVLDNFFIFLPKGVNIVDLYFFKYELDYWKDFFTFIWFVSQRVTLLLSLSIWFIINRAWWKYSLLIPISILILQLIEAVNPNARQIVEHELINGVIILTVMLIMLVFIIRKVGYYFLVLELERNTGNLINIITKKISDESNQNVNLYKKLNDLMKNKDQMELESYLKQLNEIKKNIYEKN